MVAVLNAAAVYNLAWGAFVVLFPGTMFVWAGLETPNYPSIVQCLGMVIGVYGIGYAIAARDPATHWPIVFVGLLGKLFGPIGFVWATLRGEFPPIAWLTILTNDLVWWLPFTAILVYAVREQDARRHAGDSTSLAEALQTAKTDSGPSLWDLSHVQPVLVVLIRHTGCAFCRETLADLKSQLPRIRQFGAQAVVVHMSPSADGRKLLDRYGLNDVPQISDPDRNVYRAIELPLGTLSQLAGPNVIWRALIDGALFRHGLGPMVGNTLQLAGAVLIDRGQIVRAYRHQTTADRPDYADVACDVTPALAHQPR
jgi:peroxiredoxin